MALSILCLVLSFYFVFLSSALPNPALSTRQTLATETWHIPRLNMHMMTSGTGIPGNPPWPDESKFNSTIDFDVLIPAAAGSQKWNCRGAMVNGTIIQGLAECLRGGEGVEGGLMFGMQKYDAPGERRAELSFELWLSRTGLEGAQIIPLLSGHTPITANDAKESSSYLTCLLGRPYDGLRCQIKSYLSVNKELVIEGSAVHSSKNVEK